MNGLCYELCVVAKRLYKIFLLLNCKLLHHIIVITILYVCTYVPIPLCLLNRFHLFSFKFSIECVLVSLINNTMLNKLLDLFN